MRFCSQDCDQYREREPAKRSMKLAVVVLVLFVAVTNAQPPQNRRCCEFLIQF